MNAGKRTVVQFVRTGGLSSQGENVCLSCRISISRRHYAQAAAAVAEPKQHAPPPAEAASPKLKYRVQAGVVLSRPPQITRDLTPFEKSYFLYQRRLNERLALPFTKYLYYTKDTPADVDEKRKRKLRLTNARDIGRYDAWGKEGWNDELLVGAQESEPEHQVEAILEDARPPAMDEAEAAAIRAKPLEKPPPRWTDADEIGDTKSLNRALQRTLYLLVKSKDGKWTFPYARLVDYERLHRAAERIIVESGGVNMNTWVVGNVPVGYYGLENRDKAAQAASADGVKELGQKTFFMKARIMAGQADLHDNKLGWADFAWLAKDEIKPKVDSGYWRAIEDIMGER